MILIVARPQHLIRAETALHLTVYLSCPARDFKLYLRQLASALDKKEYLYLWGSWGVSFSCGK